MACHFSSLACLLSHSSSCFHSHISSFLVLLLACSSGSHSSQDLASLLHSPISTAPLTRFSTSFLLSHSTPVTGWIVACLSWVPALSLVLPVYRKVLLLFCLVGLASPQAFWATLLFLLMALSSSLFLPLLLSALKLSSSTVTTLGSHESFQTFCSHSSSTTSLVSLHLL